MPFTSFNCRFKKRERTQNWATHEKNVLFDVVKQYVKLIDNKTTTPADKSRTWMLIHTKFNEVSDTERDVSRIREQWRRMKGHAKLEMASYNTKVKTVGLKLAEKSQPSELSLKIWHLCLNTKQSENESDDGSENADTTDQSTQSIPIQKCDSNSQEFLGERVSPSREIDITEPCVKLEIENENENKNDIEPNNDSQDKNFEETSNNNEYNENIHLNSVKCKRRKLDITERVNGDIIEEPQRIYIRKNLHRKSVSPLKINQTGTNAVPILKAIGIKNISVPSAVNEKPLRVFIRENLQQESVPPLETSQMEHNKKIELLNIQLECAKLQRETALNELKISSIKRQMIENEAAQQIESQVKMIGERGSGVGKGGGGGGSIREAGGSFGKMEAAHEDQYFYNLQKEQISKLRDGLHDEISFHEEQIKRHQEAINRHKKRITDMEKE